MNLPVPAPSGTGFFLKKGLKAKKRETVRRIHAAASPIFLFRACYFFNVIIKWKRKGKSVVSGGRDPPEHSCGSGRFVSFGGKGSTLSVRKGFYGGFLVCRRLRQGRSLRARKFFSFGIRRRLRRRASLRQKFFFMEKTDRKGGYR